MQIVIQQTYIKYKSIIKKMLLQITFEHLNLQYKILLINNYKR